MILYATPPPCPGGISGRVPASAGTSLAVSRLVLSVFSKSPRRRWRMFENRVGSASTSATARWAKSGWSRPSSGTADSDFRTRLTSGVMQSRPCRTESELSQVIHDTSPPTAPATACVPTRGHLAPSSSQSSFRSIHAPPAKYDVRVRAFSSHIMVRSERGFHAAPIHALSSLAITSADAWNTLSTSGENSTPDSTTMTCVALLDRASVSRIARPTWRE
mmetsp:Transcript_27267/g.65010  ORF Transcript_27267/g.65010 Transcript_27267/m.65010 type:complete len:219 (-) Transcript_27267:259-915(-)